MDGYNVENEPLNVIRQLILGPAGTSVKLAFRRQGYPNLIHVNLVRERADDSKNHEQRYMQEVNQLRDRHRREMASLEDKHNETVFELQQSLREAESKITMLEKELNKRLSQLEDSNHSRELLQESIRAQNDTRNKVTVEKESMQIRIESLENEVRRLHEELMHSRQQLQSQPPPRPASPPPTASRKPPEDRVLLVENTQTISGSAGVGLILDDDPNLVLLFPLAFFFFGAGGRLGQNSFKAF